MKVNLVTNSVFSEKPSENQEVHFIPQFFKVPLIKALRAKLQVDADLLLSRCTTGK